MAEQLSFDTTSMIDCIVHNAELRERQFSDLEFATLK
jgi:hypothetical protein